jgi:hypothetical protein
LKLSHTSWSKAGSFIKLEADGDFATKKAWSKKEKAALKSKFQGFNSEIADQFNTQKHYIISDPDLRKIVQNDTQKLLVEPYQKFFDRCCNCIQLLIL